MTERTDQEVFEDSVRALETEIPGSERNLRLLGKEVPPRPARTWNLIAYRDALQAHLAALVKLTTGNTAAKATETIPAKPAAPTASASAATAKPMSLSERCLAARRKSNQ